ncbi:MAG: class I mannose-6-phosphate isomerase [Verrucomicrobiales bacterium]|nr:class I mannose-6-phosphate isomerase [Verrucomicrobiales bacterium]
MPSTDPYIRFEPIYQTRVWGGRTLESHLNRSLPDDGQPYGESWEISAREEANSVIIGGAHRGGNLLDLWADDDTRLAVFGPDAPDSSRFPLLFKILDARDRLSIQVHPPAEIAEELNGEPKSEVWYIAHAEPGAELYIGVEEGVTEESFRKALEEGNTEELVHTIRPETGQHIYIPSGRLHAIGAGLLIYEIQENSDTTYRVYDWGRLGLDGNPRDLHIEESLKCIDFSDITPAMDVSSDAVICECDYFRLEKHEIAGQENIQDKVADRFAIIAVTSGSLTADGAEFREGDFFMTPAGADTSTIVADADTSFLLTTWPG